MKVTAMLNLVWLRLDRDTMTGFPTRGMFWAQGRLQLEAKAVLDLLLAAYKDAPSKTTPAFVAR